MREDALLVLRLWRDGSGADSWRASLTDLRTREVRHFADVRSLTDHLSQRLLAPSLGDAPDDAPDVVADDAPDLAPDNASHDATEDATEDATDDDEPT